MQATLPSKPEQNTSVPMMRGVWVAYAVVSWCYFGVSCAGYWAFGNSVMSNVIFSIGHPKWMVAMADLFVTVHVIGSYQVSPLFNLRLFAVTKGSASRLLMPLMYNQCSPAFTRSAHAALLRCELQLMHVVATCCLCFA